jgi:hypothetical protein
MVSQGTIPQGNDNKENKEVVTVSVRCMKKLVWDEVVILAKRKRIRMNDYMEDILTKHLVENGIDVNNLQ